MDMGCDVGFWDGFGTVLAFVTNTCFATALQNSACSAYLSGTVLDFGVTNLPSLIAKLWRTFKDHQLTWSSSQPDPLQWRQPSGLTSPTLWSRRRQKLNSKLL